MVDHMLPAQDGDTCRYLSKICEMLPGIVPENGVEHYNFHMMLQETQGYIHLRDYARASKLFNLASTEIYKCIKKKP
jgi:hypothetical protein